MEELEIKALQDRFDMRYKLLKDCNDDMERAYREHHALDNRLSVLESKQNFNNFWHLAGKRIVSLSD